MVPKGLFPQYAVEIDGTACRGIAEIIWNDEIEGEAILTEYSHKYTLESFAVMAGQAGFRVEKVWTDDNNLFSVQFLVAM